MQSLPDWKSPFSHCWTVLSDLLPVLDNGVDQAVKSEVRLQGSSGKDICTCCSCWWPSLHPQWSYPLVSSLFTATRSQKWHERCVWSHLNNMHLFDCCCLPCCCPIWHMVHGLQIGLQVPKRQTRSLSELTGELCGMYQPLLQRMTILAVVRLIPRPPMWVVSKKSYTCWSHWFNHRVHQYCSILGRTWWVNIQQWEKKMEEGEWDILHWGKDDKQHCWRDMGAWSCLTG